LIGLYVLAVVASAITVINRESFDSLSPESGLGGLISHLRSSSPLRWLILPFGIVFAPYFATDMPGFLLAIIPALGVLAIHYYWVSSTEYRFEEGSIALAQTRTAIREAIARGEAPKVGSFKPKAQPGPFPLSPTGPQEIAFLWKNLVSMRSSVLSRRTVIMALTITGWLSFVIVPLFSHSRGREGLDFYGPIIVLFCAIAAGYTLLLGPQIARQDLRSDLPNADILKTFPIASWRLALGEILAPASILSLVLWFLIIVCTFMVDSGGQLEWLTTGVRITAALCMAAAAPVLCVVQLIVPNLIMLLLPGWFQASRSRGGGIELFGQRFILGIAQLLMALLVAAPGAIAAALIIFSAHLFIGVGASIVLSALVVLPIMAGEVAVGLWWIGERFDRFDPSTEIK
jgi:ABC-2 type transport system permease protein